MDQLCVAWEGDDLEDSDTGRNFQMTLSSIGPVDTVLSSGVKNNN